MTSLKIAFLIAAAASAGLGMAARADAGVATLTIAADPSATGDLQPEIGDVKTCAVPSRNAAVDGTAYVEYPLFAEATQASGTAQVAVELGANGSLQNAGVIGSTGISALDFSALRTVRLTKFSPEVRNCRTVAGRYIVSITYTALT